MSIVQPEFVRIMSVPESWRVHCGMDLYVPLTVNVENYTLVQQGQ